MMLGPSVAILTSVFPPGRAGPCHRHQHGGRLLGLVPGTRPRRLPDPATSAGGACSSPVVPVGRSRLVLTSSRLRGNGPRPGGDLSMVAGRVVFGLGLASLMYGLFAPARRARGGPRRSSGLAVSAAFILWEKRRRLPSLMSGFSPQPGLRLLQRGRPDQLQRDVGRLPSS